MIGRREGHNGGGMKGRDGREMKDGRGKREGIE
jgi:hypothetical protein